MRAVFVPDRVAARRWIGKCVAEPHRTDLIDRAERSSLSKTSVGIARLLEGELIDWLVAAAMVLPWDAGGSPPLDIHCLEFASRPYPQILCAFTSLDGSFVFIFFDQRQVNLFIKGYGNGLSWEARDDLRKLRRELPSLSLAGERQQVCLRGFAADLLCLGLHWLGRSSIGLDPDHSPLEA